MMELVIIDVSLAVVVLIVVVENAIVVMGAVYV